MYDFMFSTFYSFLKSIEFGSDFVTEKSRAQQSILLISIFELLNIMSAFDSIRGYNVFLPFGALIALNYFYFLVGGRYFKIMKVKPLRNGLLRLFVALYLFATIVIFAVTR